jgi:hypothetical protein
MFEYMYIYILSYGLCHGGTERNVRRGAGHGMSTVTSFSNTAFAHRRREQHEAPAPSCIVLYNSSSTAFYSLDFYVILSAGWRDAEVRTASR